MIPRVYVDLDVLSYMAELPTNEFEKIPMAKGILKLADQMKIELVISMAAIKTSLDASLGMGRLSRERYVYLLREFRAVTEKVRHITLEINLVKAEELVDKYKSVGVAKAENRMHLACATLCEVDYFLTWDEEHILARKGEIKEFNRREGLKIFEIRRPQDLEVS